MKTKVVGYIGPMGSVSLFKVHDKYVLSFEMGSSIGYQTVHTIEEGLELFHKMLDAQS